MKNVIKLKIIAVIIAFASLTFSCTEETDELNTAINDVDLTTIGIIKGNPIFSQLVKAIELAELSETLKSKEPYTLLAPSNDAFTTFLKTTPYKTLNEVPKPLLKQILLNHVLEGKVLLRKSKDEVLDKEFKTGYIKTLATGASSSDNNLSMYVDLTAVLTLNGVAKVLVSNLTAPNGVVHTVDNVLFLPTVATHLTANPTFKSAKPEDPKSLVENMLMLDALKAKDDPTKFLTLLSSTGPFTVFAPTNTAFTAFNTELAPRGLAGVSNTNITKILQYHVTNGSFLAASLIDAQVVATLETPQTFEIQLTGGPKIKDVRNRISNITFTDIQCDNGVIHILDKVLRPNY